MNTKLTKLTELKELLLHHRPDILSGKLRVGICVLPQDVGGYKCQEYFRSILHRKVNQALAQLPDICTSGGEYVLRTTSFLYNSEEMYNNVLRGSDMNIIVLNQYLGNRVTLLDKVVELLNEEILDIGVGLCN